jgi:hypothetical protein
VQAALPCEQTDGQTDNIRTPQVACNDFFANTPNNPFPLKFPSINQPVCRIQINGQGKGWKTLCDDRSFYRPPGMVIDLLISVILYWYIWSRNITHSSLDSDVITLSAGHSDHSFLFQLHSATLHDAAPSQTRRTLLDNRGTIYSAGNQNTSVHPSHFLVRHSSCWKRHVSCPMDCPHCILQIPVRYPRHSSPRKQWMGLRNQVLLITEL